MKLSINKTTKSGLSLLLVGGIIFLFADAWATQSAHDPSIVGANIGAGVLGMVGLLIGLAGILVLVVDTVSSSKK